MTSESVEKVKSICLFPNFISIAWIHKRKIRRERKWERKGEERKVYRKIKMRKEKQPVKGHHTHSNDASDADSIFILLCPQRRRGKKG